MKKNIKGVIVVFSILCTCFLACGTVNEAQTIDQSEVNVSEEAVLQPESSKSSSNTDNSDESILAPSKEEVLSMRTVVLEGMNEEEIDRLTENIKVANLTMESAYLNDNIFDKLSDPDRMKC